MFAYSDNEVKMFNELLGKDLVSLQEWPAVKVMYDWGVVRCFLGNLQTSAAGNLRKTYEAVWIDETVGRNTPEFEALFVWPT
jgi:hypothetical protein